MGDVNPIIILDISIFYGKYLSENYIGLLLASTWSQRWSVKCAEKFFRLFRDSGAIYERFVETYGLYFSDLSVFFWTNLLHNDFNNI